MAGVPIEPLTETIERVRRELADVAAMSPIERRRRANAVAWSIKREQRRQLRNARWRASRQKGR